MVFFGLLAVLIARLIPLFAIVGGVVLALNVQEFLSRREAKDPTRVAEHDLWANLARLLTGFLLFGLFFLAWPGWVNHTIGDYTSPQRVAWNVEEEASLQRAALFLEKMHQEGQLKRGFNLSADIASYCAWRALPAAALLHRSCRQSLRQELGRLQSYPRGAQAGFAEVASAAPLERRL